MAEPLLTCLHEQMPLKFLELSLTKEKNTGLVIVDEVNGFCTVGMGNLAPQSPNFQIDKMVEETNKLAKKFSSLNWPIFAFLDTHERDRPEPPYPPHCIIGTGEENLVPDLSWMEKDKNVTLLRKDCINGFIGSIRADGSNAFIEWASSHEIEQVIVVGICTDICVMDFVLTLLSARNHLLMNRLKDVYVYTDACSTFDLPLSIAKQSNLPIESSHPQDATHYLGLYFMHSRGASLINKINFDSSST